MVGVSTQERELLRADEALWVAHAVSWVAGFFDGLRSVLLPRKWQVMCIPETSVIVDSLYLAVCTCVVVAHAEKVGAARAEEVTCALHIP